MPPRSVMTTLLLRLGVLLLGVGLSFGQSVRGRIPVSIVDGRLVVSCDLSTPSRRIPVNLLVEFEQPHGLVLHNRAAAPLNCERPDGTTVPIRIHLPEFDLTVERRELGDEEFFEEFTKYHSEELGENALVGSIGYEVLGQHAIRFDLARRVLELRPLGPEPIGGVVPTRHPDGSWTLPLSEHAGLLWVTATAADGTPYALAVGCSRYDTLVDQLVCEQRSKPAGDIGPLRLGDVDLTEFVAPRPEPLALVHPDEPLGVLGIGLLEHLSLDVDRGARTAVLRVTKAPSFPEADEAFFRARLDEDADTMEAFLEAHPEARLAPEAAELLLVHRFDEFAPAEDTARAVEWIGRTILEDLRTTRLLDLMKELGDDGREEELLHAGALAVESGRKDRYPNAVHEVHGRLGHVRLERGEGREAWRHLLSASFGLPGDGPINLDLGRYYESQGRHRRAFSRYVQAVMSPDSGPAALEAMARVQAQLDPEEPFGVELVERLIAGKVRNFGSATRFVASETTPANKTVLIEHFTNAWLGDVDRGAIGGALAFEGLLSHYQDAPVVLLSHHLPAPRVDSLCTSFAEKRAQRFGIDQPVLHLVDGRSGQPGAGRHRDAEGIFGRVRGATNAALAGPGEFELELEASLAGEELAVRVDALGPTEADRRIVVVLAERGVLYPGSTGVVVHRHVVRAELTDGGVPWDPVDGFQELELSANLSELEARQERHLDELAEQGVGSTVRVSMRPEPSQLFAVAWVEDSRTGHVLAVTQAPCNEEAQ